MLGLIGGTREQEKEEEKRTRKEQEKEEGCDETAWTDRAMPGE